MKRGAILMEINQSIECEVDECKFHDQSSEHCTLNKIKVEKNETRATNVESTDCGSFVAR